ncbi:MAG: S8 family peptidase [Flavobacteriaceae bacterium]|nr:S8 family peptidase [Flavobacteriaceae bacterium]
MRITKILFGIGTLVSLIGCSSANVAESSSAAKAIQSKAVPAGDMNAVVMAAKNGKMSESEIEAWPHADILTDTVPGMSLAQAYKFLEGKKVNTIVVGVIDSGIDINHEDLKDQVWTNPKDIAGNNVDEDKNGHTDDAHGWNFLGGEKGKATPEQLEVTRLYKKYSAKYAGVDPAAVPEKDKKEYESYLKIKADFEKRLAEATKNYEYFQGLSVTLKDADAAVKTKLGKSDYTLADLNALPEAEKNPMLLRIYSSGGTVADAEEQLKGGIDYYGSQVKTMYNLDFNGRAATGDNPDDIKDLKYGNPWVIGSVEDESHGSHVAGIVLASRNNGKGMNGVTNNVKLITARAVPDGDEYDKDVALAIRYMADMGAKVVNMSFGKSYSPNAEWVYEAIKYAESKDVLLVHAAGNDGKDIDKSDNFPTDTPDKLKEIVGNYITVGASTRNYNEKLVAGFSNYGKRLVDIFAPGLEIYSTVPNNKYESLQGTSMAAPQVAGVAALIRSYYPELSAKQVKQIIMNSGTKVDLEVILPKGEGKKVPFSELSVSGRVLNAHNAVKMADSMVNGK